MYSVITQEILLNYMYVSLPDEKPHNPVQKSNCDSRVFLVGKKDPRALFYMEHIFFFYTNFKSA